MILNATPAQKRNFRDMEVFIKNVLGEQLWEKQLEIVRSVKYNKRTAVRTCHGIGKTRVSSGIALAYLYTHYNSIVLTTAPTWRQVTQQLWREIRGRHNNALTDLYGTKFLTPRYEISDNWYSIGLSTREPEKFQGYHAPYMLIIVDEASGVEPKIFEAIHGIMASGECRLLLLGNPTQRSGEFYDAFHKGSGVYNKIHVSAWSTPNLAPYKAQYQSIESLSERLSFLRSLPIKIPYLVNASYVADMLEEFGENSSIVRVRVDGEFPNDDPSQLISLAWVTAAEDRWNDLVEEEQWWLNPRSAPNDIPIIVGADVARYGSCETVFMARRGNVVAPPLVLTKMSTVEVAGRLKIFAEEMGADQINVDSVGIGAGVVDSLEAWGINCNAVNVGESALEQEKYANLRAELWWKTRKFLESPGSQACLPPDPRLPGQLTTVKYDAKTGKIRVETKEDMQKRGLISPDRADALCLTMNEVSREGARIGSAGSTKRQWGGMDVPERFQAKKENQGGRQNRFCH